MKVALLAPAGVIHTQRWVEALHAGGVEVALLSQHDGGDWRPPAGVRMLRLPHAGALGYFRNAGAVRRLLRSEAPALLNAHYASGYGTTAALCGFHPLLLSVWGSDVYDFPCESRLKGWLLRRNLRHADRIASTSEAMAAQVRRLVPDAAPALVTPFGIDTQRFAPEPREHTGFVVGTVKTLAPKYGIDVLLRAFAALGRAEQAAGGPADASLVVVGDGPQRGELEALAARLGIAGRVRFAGRVAHAEVPAWLNSFDVYVAASRLDSESFGVAVLEASACGLPVVVSDAGGLPEVVVHDETGLVVPRDDAEALAAALRRLQLDAPWRRDLGAAGRARVLACYEWTQSVERMLRGYREVIAAHAGSAAARMAHPSTVAGDAGALASAGRADVVSVIVPCRNERSEIERFCATVLEQALPDQQRLELLIADGASDDGTRELLDRMAANDPRIRLVDNPRRIVSTGLNRALAAASGAVVVRMDVHTDYAADYLVQCLSVLGETGADNVGGAWRAEPAGTAGAMQKAAAAAFQSRWVAGGAASRDVRFEGLVDTVYLGAWPRATFLRFGTFDETLVRNQDDEHNLRIVRGGGRVWQSARIRSTYRPRARLGQVFRQYLQYGYWKPFVMKKHGQPASLRHLMPALFVLALGLALLAAAAAGWRWPLAALVVAYVAAVLGLSAGVARSARPGLAVMLRVPLVIATYHLAYGVGAIAGWWDAFVRRRARPGFTTLTR